MTEKETLHVEKRSPAAFMRSIFAMERFSKKKKTIPAMTRKVSIKNVKRPPKYTNYPPMKGYQYPLAKPLFPFSKQVKLKRVPTFTSSELSLALTDASPSGTFYRGSSGNVMLASNLGNLKPKRSNVTPLINKESILTSKVISSKVVVKKPPTEELEPERLNVEGNEKHKKGEFEEALSFYNEAITLDPKRASYYSNKSASLMGLGRLVDATFACREAVQIDPSYERAHHRLATLYFRLGEADKSLYHYKESGPMADTTDMAKSQALRTLVTKCKEAREKYNWDLITKESQAAITLGADSATQIYAMLVEALLKLQMHQEAYNIYQQGPHFDSESCERLLGPSLCTYLLTVQAQVYLAAGRFEDALTSCHEVIRYSPTDEDACRVRAAVLARSNGNKLFKLCKFVEASTEYSKGLDIDPHNATLLCNRAACKLKSLHLREALDDCNGALRFRPTYSKARLRRAECYVKLQRWDAAIQDYEILTKESPEDQKLNKAMLDAVLQLRKQQGDSDSKGTRVCSNFVSVSTNEQFEHLVASPGICVVLFCKRKRHKRALELVHRICKEFPSYNFLKVEAEDHPLLAKSVGEKSNPRFMIYKNGFKVEDCASKERDLIQRLLKSYSC